MTDLCETFRRESASVWNRMRQAAKLGISLSEETLTECALYGIAASHQQQGIVIDLATKPAESKHGADWEWWLVRQGKGICFRVQAKRLYPDGKYRALKKPGLNPYAQLDKLVKESKQVGAYPLYCFYNFHQAQVSFSGPNLCNHSYRAPSYWGCSLAFPEQIKNVGSDKLTALRPHLYPWHLLVCQSASVDLPTAGARFVSERRGIDEPKLRSLPPRIAELIEFGASNRERSVREQLPPSFWQPSEEIPDDVAGLVVFRDLRSSDKPA